MHRIAKQLDGLEFDWYVAISRGGLVPAALLSQITGQRNIDTFCIQRYGDDNKEKTITADSKDIAHLRDKRILIVDDLLDHGRTMKFVLDVIAICEPQDIKVAVLYWKPRSIVIPDFYIEKCDDDIWIDFPWELNQCFVLPKSYVKKEKATSV